MVNIIKRESGWTGMNAQELIKMHAVLDRKQSSHHDHSVLKYVPPQNQLTRSENFGQYVRELFNLYSSILSDMKQSSDWIALQVRSTYHSKANYSDSVIIGDENDSEQVQVRGFHFNPTRFTFTWEDISMQQPWKPWNWQIGIFTDDLDETHYFFNLQNDQLIMGKDSSISFYNLNPKLPKDLTLFQYE